MLKKPLQKDTGERSIAFASPKRSKNFYSEYLRIVDFGAYTKITLEDLIRHFLSTKKVDLRSILVYRRVKSAGFSLESGLSFGFDFVIYKADSNGAPGSNKLPKLLFVSARNISTPTCKGIVAE